MHLVTQVLEPFGLVHPLTFAVLFVAVSLFMIWRLEAMASHGLEGTALGTLITPYCSGLGNLFFVYLMVREGGNGTEVMTNCLVNNVTNLTLLLGLPAVLWGLDVFPSGPSARGGRRPSAKGARVQTEQRISRLSLLLTMTAVAFFTGATWVLGQDGKLDTSDGLVLVGLFLFWQCFQVFDVMKHNIRERQSFGLGFYLDVLGLILGGIVMYESLDALVAWLSSQKSGFFRSENLGWISGWLMVLPNAILALYYGAKRRADVVYASQIGDGHICIPLCVGLYALASPLALPPFFETGILILGGALALHFLLVLLIGRLPRLVGVTLLGAYSWFLYQGLL